MAGMNQCIFIGYLGSDPELTKTTSGAAVVTFSIGINQDYTNNSGELVKHTEWVRLVLFEKSAEFAAKYLKKGSLICPHFHGQFKQRF